MAKTVSSHDEFSTNDNDDHLEIVSLIWLDANANIQETQDTQEKLRSIMYHLKTFHDGEECKKYIEQTSKYDRLVLIISGQMGRQVVPFIHQLRQVLAIYVNSKDKESNEKWACEFAKVRYF
jgi:response regulator RpfG family c-di-GMP phosphodiesterase